MDDQSPDLRGGGGLTGRLVRPLSLVMQFRSAAKLHNSDEITLKATGEIGYVLTARKSKTAPKTIEVEAVFSRSGYLQVTHRDIS